MDVEFCQMLFSIYGDDHVFVLLFVDVVHDADGFSNVVPSLHPWDESHLILMDDLFEVSLNSVS